MRIKKPKPIITWLTRVSRAWHGLRVFTSSSYWFIALLLEYFWLARFDHYLGG